MHQVDGPRRNRFEKARAYWVCVAHEEQLRQFLQRAERQQTAFLGSVGLGIASAVLPLFVESPAAMGVPLLVIGLGIVAFPFAAPLTIARNGIGGAIVVLRIIGIVLIAFGVLFCTLAMP